jgi:hypothetical protein
MEANWRAYRSFLCFTSLKTNSVSDHCKSYFTEPIPINLCWNYPIGILHYPSSYTDFSNVWFWTLYEQSSHSMKTVTACRDNDTYAMMGAVKWWFRADVIVSLELLYTIVLKFFRLVSFFSSSVYDNRRACVRVCVCACVCVCVCACARAWVCVCGGGRVLLDMIQTWNLLQFWCGYIWYGGPGSIGIVSIANGYGLDGLGIKSRWGRDFPHLSRTVLGPTQPCTMGTVSFPG